MKNGQRYINCYYVTVKGDGWEMFDAGIACQTFSLAAHEKGLGSVILVGIFDEEKVAEVIDLPGGEVDAVIIPLGYPVVPGRGHFECYWWKVEGNCSLSFAGWNDAIQ